MYEIRSTTNQVKPAGNRVVGYASVFYTGEPGTEYEVYSDSRGYRIVDRVAPGAYNLDRDVLALFNHDRNLLLGRTSAGTLNLSIDERGLSYEVTIGDTTIAKDVAEHLRRDDLSGSSIGFKVRQKSYSREGRTIIRNVEKLDIYDVGPVTSPAFKASTAELKSILFSNEAKRKRARAVSVSP